jgi:hypothetical protein
MSKQQSEDEASHRNRLVLSLLILKSANVARELGLAKTAQSLMAVSGAAMLPDQEELVHALLIKHIKEQTPKLDDKITVQKSRN